MKAAAEQRIEENERVAARKAAPNPKAKFNADNQNYWSSYKGVNTGFIGSAAFWGGAIATLAAIGAGIAVVSSPGLITGGNSTASVSQSFAQLSVFIQPALLLVLIWVVAFTTHRAKIQNNAIFQLIRASNKLFTPTDRAINEINSLQDAVAVSLDTIERKITSVKNEGNSLTQQFYSVLREINEASEANVSNITNLIAEADEQRQFLQHANLMITTEANYELERNATNVRRVLQMLKSEIENFMERLYRDTSMMSEISTITANETEVVKIMTDDLRTIVNSSYRVIQSAVEEGQNSFKTALMQVEDSSTSRLESVGAAVIEQIQQAAKEIIEQFTSVSQELEATLKRSGNEILESINQQAKVNAISIEATTIDANEAVMQKVESRIAAMHTQLAEVIDGTSNDMERKLRELLAQIERQRKAAVKQITQKMNGLPESMRASAMEAITLIDKTAEETSVAFNTASAQIVTQSQQASADFGTRAEMLEKLVSDMERRMNTFDNNMHSGFESTQEGVRATVEDIRKSINAIQAEYLEVINSSLSQLNAIKKPAE